MEISKVEVDALDKVILESTEHQVKELNELQLALVGGGIAIVIVIAADQAPTRRHLCINPLLETDPPTRNRELRGRYRIASPPLSAPARDFRTVFWSFSGIQNEFHASGNARPGVKTCCPRRRIHHWLVTSRLTALQ